MTLIGDIKRIFELHKVRFSLNNLRNQFLNLKLVLPQNRCMLKRLVSLHESTKFKELACF